MDPTPSQQQLIERIRALLHEEAGIGAAWLSGSLAVGTGDAFSDVDVVALAMDSPVSEVSDAIATRLGALCRPVLVNRLFGGRILSVVTEDWQRFDISIVLEEDLGRYDALKLKSLFNRSGKTPPVQPEVRYQPTEEALRPLVTEFLRILGLTVVVVGREEYALALSGIEHLRRMTFDLMLEENAVPPWKRGGALHRNPLLTAEQRAELLSLPPLVAKRDSVLDGHRAFAEIFLPRAKRLATRIGMSWPTDFENSTSRYLETNLGLSI